MTNHNQHHQPLYLRVKLYFLGKSPYSYLLKYPWSNYALQEKGNENINIFFPLESNLFFLFLKLILPMPSNFRLIYFNIANFIDILVQSPEWVVMVMCVKCINVAFVSKIFMLYFETVIRFCIRCFFFYYRHMHHVTKWRGIGTWN